jgi:hypothetical protein
MAALDAAALDDRYFDLPGLAAYSGLSVRTLRRHMADPTHPLPTHHVRTAGKDRGKVLVRKAAFDAWVAAFPPAEAPTATPKAEQSLDERVARAVAQSRRG